MKKKNRILAPTTYIFFASAIPVITFGEQLERDTGTTTTLLLLHLLSLILVRDVNLCVFVSFCYLVRWEDNSCSNLSFNCIMWSDTFHYRRPAIVDSRCCRAYCYNVHLHVQLRQKQTRLGV